MGARVTFAVHQEQDLFAVVTIERTGFSPHERACARSPLSCHIPAIEDVPQLSVPEFGIQTPQAARPHHNEAKSSS